MLEWTGERFLPWRKDPALAYEHLHRYLYAAQLVAGKAVLDLASGEGYGSNILAKTAARVVGLDIDGSAVEHARNRYVRGNLEYLAGSVTEIPIEGSAFFDVVVCFEAIEHIEDQDRLLTEVSRLLKPGGVFLVSTPNKGVYDATIEEENEFHVRELDFDEFQTLLGRHFQHVRFLGQRIYAESNMWPIGDGNATTVAEFVVERGDSEFELMGPNERIPMYLVAVASNVAIDDSLPTSILVDNANELLNEKDRAIRELRETNKSHADSLSWRAQQVEERDRSIAWYDGETRALTIQIQKFTAEIAAHKAWHEREVTDLSETIGHLKATVASHEEALAWRAGQVEFLERDKAALIQALETTTARLEALSDHLEMIHASTGWRFIVTVRRYRDTFLPAGSARRRFLEQLRQVFKR